MTTLRTAAGQYFTAISRLHTFTKTMYGFTTTTMGLKCTFHCIIFLHLSKMRMEKHPFQIHQQVTTPVVCERTAKVREQAENAAGKYLFLLLF
jgi:hypothetical protein